MLNGPQLDEAAQRIVRGRQQPPRAIGHLPDELRPRTVQQAMAIQTRVHQQLSQIGYGPLVGTKIGCTTQVMQRYLGMDHPCSGGIFASTLQPVDGTVDHRRYLHVGVECEIAALLQQPIRAAEAPHDLDSVARSVGSLAAAIEIVDDRYVDFANRIPDWRTWIADDFFGAGAVVGHPVFNWQRLNLPDLHGEMRINGRSVGQGYGRDIINGHPLEALVWLANDWASRRQDLPADWVVMLGSVVQTQWIKRGDEVEIDIDHLGSARCRFQLPPL